MPSQQLLLISELRDKRPPRPVALRRNADLPLRAVDLHREASVLLHSHADYEGALRALSRAIELQPQSSLLYKERALVHRKLNRWPDAIGDYAQARALEECAERRAAARGRGHGPEDKRSE